MSYKIEKILRTHYVRESEYTTHVSLVQPKGRFQFSREDLELFWDVYCDLILSNDAIIGIAEKPQPYLPVLVDVDIKVKNTEFSLSENMIHLYTEEQLMQVINIYQSVIKEIINNCSNDNLMCCILEKSIYYVTTGDNINQNIYIKNGFHLHFPNLFLSTEVQETHLIPRVLEQIKNLQIFKNLGIEDSSKVIDQSYFKTPWLLYGSRKAENMEPYILTKIIDYSGQEITLEKAFKSYKIYDIHENVININTNIKKYLPRILSILPYGRPVSELKLGILLPTKEKMKKENKENKIEKIAKVPKISIMDALTISAKLLPMLSDYRASEYNEWITIGWVLYNIGDGCSQALEQWIDFSSRCEDKFDETKCTFEWERMSKRDLTLGTLHYYASIDNPEAYKIYRKEKAESYIKESLINGSHNDIAKVLYVEYSNEFVCASISNQIWYQFKHHRWEEIEDGIFLRTRISDQIVSKYTEISKEIMSKLGAVEDKAEEAMYNVRLKQVQKIIGNLKSAPFKNNVMKEAMEVFYDRRFKDKLDKDPELIGFRNGIYELKTHIFRSGRPEDFISKCIPIDYVVYDENDQEVEQIKNFLLQVFPDTSVRDYFLDIYSDVFVGGNTQKKVYLWTGEGDNGKSITQSFFEKMLGELAIKFNTQYFTGKKSSTGAANPELARAAPPVRYATMEEPDADEQLNIGELKKLSGGDSYWARDLFEKGKSTKEVYPMFMLTFVCLCGDTNISLSCGISISLKYFSKLLLPILAWNKETDTLLPVLPTKFLVQNKQKTITLIMKDGREIVCTPTHRFLDINNIWIKAEDIKINDTNLKMSLDNPNSDDIFIDSNFVDNNFVLESDINYNLLILNDRLKVAALFRIIGYLYCTYSNLQEYFILNVKSKIDANNIISDIILLTNKYPKLTEYKKSYLNFYGKINLPFELCLLINKIAPHIHTALPKIIFNKNCPLFIIREFIAGMFSGSNCYLSKLKNNNFSGIKLSIYKYINYLNNSTLNPNNNNNKLSELLFNRFNIKSFISYSNDLSCTEENITQIYLVIDDNNSIINYINNIGFRYNYYKSYKSTAILSCLNFKQNIINQNTWILEKVKELLKYKKTLIGIYKNLLIAKEEYKNKNKFINNEYIITISQTIYFIFTATNYNININYKKYLKEINLYRYVSTKNNQLNNYLPVFNMNVVAIYDSGEKDVFDLCINQKYHNFVAKGIITHNCNKLPKLRQSDKATWNRLRVIPFESTFVEPGQPCPETFEQQILEKRFPMDKTFSYKIPSMLSVFAWYLLEWRKRIKSKDEPIKVKEATEIYKKQNDLYLQFINERIIECEKSIIILNEIYLDFKEWYREGWSKISVPIKNELKDYLDKKWGESSRCGKWKGYRLRTLDDDIADGSVIILNENDFSFKKQPPL